MPEPISDLTRRSFVGGAAVVAAASLVCPSTAFAVTAAEKQAEADAVRNQLVGLNADLEVAAEHYYGALDEQDAARSAMEAEQVKIDEATAQITNLQDHLGTRARSMYRSGSSTFLDFLMGSTSFTELTQNWDILSSLNESDAQMVAQTKALRESVEASKTEYAKQEKIAADKTAEAKSLKKAAEEKIAQADALMNTLDAEARTLLEEEQQAAAEAAAAQKQAEMEAQATKKVDDNPGGGGGNGVEVPSQGSVADYAMTRIGCPYKWGEEGPDLFDCSGLVTWAYRQVGISVPHQSEKQYKAARQRVSISEARPGDVLWRFGHVGIAVSDGGSHYVHAPDTGLLVRDTDPLSWSKFTCALRF